MSNDKMINDAFDPTSPTLDAWQKELLAHIVPFYVIASEAIERGSRPAAVVNGLLGTAISFAKAIDDGQFPGAKPKEQDGATRLLIFVFRESAKELEAELKAKK